RTAEAIKELQQAKAYEAKITGGNSKVAAEINRKLADMYYVQGIEPFLAGRLPEAYKSFKAALGHAPDHGPSLRKMEDLAGKAKTEFEAGYTLKELDSAKAREHWQLVLQIVPSSNEYYRKAKQWLDTLP
ncbi:MAG: hypothetical protein HYZ27_05240, partial [Deltaproteobacteria bacterium]|nr:hypothetical protein [Deltaproteobacteria bacterium]